MGASLGEGLVIRSWGTEAGLPQNTINAMAQTRDGYLWLATRDGLARFDGVRFQTFGLQDGLPSVDVSTLYVDSRGVLWVGTIGGGLCRWADGRAERVASPGQFSPGDSITAITEDATGTLWVGTTAGLGFVEADHFVQREELTSFAHVPIRALLRDRRGAMWMATGNQGLFEFKERRLVPHPGPPENEQVMAYCLLEDQPGRIWASVGNGRILCWHDGAWRVYNQNDGVPFAYVTSLAEEPDGTIWAGSLDDGLYRLQGEQFAAVKMEDGLSANDIRSLRADREGHLWVGTRTGGLNRLSRQKLAHVGAAQGLTNDFTRSVAETADGALWVGTTGGGLYRGEGGVFQPYGDATMRFYSTIESVLAAKDGSLWWGGSGGLFRARENALIACYTNLPWVRYTMVTALCEDDRGGLWIGTSKSRLFHFQDGTFTEFPHPVARGPIAALAWDTNGFLWLGSVAGGLKRVRPEDNTVLSVTNGLVSESIRALYLDGEGTLWVGTAGGGLGRWRDGRLTSFTARQGLGANTVSQIVEDDYGYLWLGCNQGIFRVRKQDLKDLAEGRTAFVHPRAFGLNDGMPAEECPGGFCPAGLKTRSGLICLSTVKGLVFFDPRRQQTHAPPPKVLVEEALVNGRVQAPEPEDHGNGPGTADGKARLTIAPAGRELELHYTGISFASPEKVSFRYRLEGYDRDWVEAGARRTAYYHKLPPGNFTFRVAACNADGIWNETGASLSITRLPYVWETSWFMAAAGLAAAGCFVGGMRHLEQRKYKRRLALLQTQNAVEKERLRISQDMHDDLGAILTQVSQLSEIGQGEAGGAASARAHFERIGAQARAAVQSLDEIIWATNPKNDNLPQFAEYVCRFADECMENTSVRCWQQVPTDLPNLPLPADVRHNVFLAVKEAFTNILKHARATEVWLKLAMKGGRVELVIEDNGRGFVPEQASPDGNGLGNMKSRLAECGGRVAVFSAPSQGTKLRFVFPLPPAAES